MDGQPVVLSDIRAPIFAVATEEDHVAPWRSVFKLNLVSDADVTFVLTSGGHNAGIVSEPGHKHRHFRISHSPSGERYIDPDTWYLSNPVVEGSWWPAWAEWLEKNSAGRAPRPRSGRLIRGIPRLARRQAVTCSNAEPAMREVRPAAAEDGAKTALFCMVRSGLSS